jgi:DNA-binding NarL/FixJ family response regulator
VKLTELVLDELEREAELSRRALEVGATGYVLKDTSSDEFLNAFQKVRAGSPYLSGNMAVEVALVRVCKLEDLDQLRPG